MATVANNFFTVLMGMWALFYGTSGKKIKKYEPIQFILSAGAKQCVTGVFLFFFLQHIIFRESFFLYAAMHKTDAPKYNHKSHMLAVKVIVLGDDKQKYCLIIEFKNEPFMT